MKRSIEDTPIVFIGAGNLATNLAKALYRKGFRIVQVYSRTEESAQCRIVQDYVIPKAADDMEIVLTHRCYECFLGKECVCNHRAGYAL